MEEVTTKESQEKVTNFIAHLFNIPYQIALVELVGQISDLAHSLIQNWHFDFWDVFIFAILELINMLSMYE